MEAKVDDSKQTTNDFNDVISKMLEIAQTTVDVVANQENNDKKDDSSKESDNTKVKGILDLYKIEEKTLETSDKSDSNDFVVIEESEIQKSEKPEEPVVGKSLIEVAKEMFNIAEKQEPTESKEKAAENKEENKNETAPETNEESKTEETSNENETEDIFKNLVGIVKEVFDASENEEETNKQKHDTSLNDNLDSNEVKELLKSEEISEISEEKKEKVEVEQTKTENKELEEQATNDETSEDAKSLEGTIENTNKSEAESTAPENEENKVSKADEDAISESKPEIKELEESKADASINDSFVEVSEQFDSKSEGELTADSSINETDENKEETGRLETVNEEANNGETKNLVEMFRQVLDVEPKENVEIEATTPVASANNEQTESFEEKLEASNATENKEEEKYECCDEKPKENSQDEEKQEINNIIDQIQAETEENTQITPSNSQNESFNDAINEETDSSLNQEDAEQIEKIKCSMQAFILESADQPEVAVGEESMNEKIEVVLSNLEKEIQQVKVKESDPIVECSNCFIDSPCKLSFDSAELKELSVEAEENEFKKFCSHISKSFNLSDLQFGLVYDFFNEKKRDEHFNSKLLSMLTKNEIKDRAQMVANENDVDRAVCSTAKQENKLDFEDFVKFLSLFFSSKHNLSERVQFLFNSRLNDSNDSLASGEANKLASFLNQFFGIEQNDENLFNQDVKFDEFINQIYPSLELAAFVKW